MTIINKKRSNLLALIVAIAMVSTMLPAGTVRAAEYTEGDQTLAINYGMAVLNVGGKSTQLTDMYVCEDGKMYTSEGHPIATMLYYGGGLTVYCADLQNNGQPIFWDKNAVKYDGQNYILKDGSSKALPSYTEVQAKITGNTNPGTNNPSNGGNNTDPGTNNPSNGGSNTNPGTNNPSNGGTTTSPISLNGSVVTFTGANGRVYTLTSSIVPVAAEYDAATQTAYVYLSNGQIVGWNYLTQQSETNPQLFTVVDRSVGFARDNTGKAIGYYNTNGVVEPFPTLSQIIALRTPSSTTPTTPAAGTYTATMESTTGYLNVQENGLWQKIPVNTNKLLKGVGVDSTTGTHYSYYSNGALKLWCYPLQKGETSKKQVKISTCCTGLAYADPNSNEIKGYYENGVLKPLYTLEQIKSAISTNTNEPSKSTYVKWYETKTSTKGNLKTVRAFDSNGKEISHVTWNTKKNTVIFNGVTVFKGGSDKILSVNYTNKSKHLILIRTKSRKCYKLYRSTGKVKKCSDSVYTFVKTNESHFISQLKLTNGSKIAAPNS